MQRYRVTWTLVSLSWEQLLTHQEGRGYMEVLLEADSTMTVAVNTSLISDDIGVSLVLQTLDASNKSSIARTVQLLGGPLAQYQLPLLVNTSSSLLL